MGFEHAIVVVVALIWELELLTLHQLTGGWLHLPDSDSSLVARGEQDAPGALADQQCLCVRSDDLGEQEGPAGTCLDPP